MKTKSRRVISLIMCIMIIAAALAAAFPMMLAHAASADILVQNGTGTNTPVKVIKTYSYRAIVNDSFTGFAFSMPTWSTNTAGATLSMYKWNGTYEQTVAGEPIAKKVFDPLTDGAYHWVEFDAQPAGEYLFHISDPKGQAGVWTNIDPIDSKGFLYENGLEGRGEPNLAIRFTDGTDDPFGTCEPSTDPRIPQSPMLNGSGQEITDVQVSDGLRLHLAAPFSGVQFMMATYHSTTLEVTFSIYEWKGNYSKTVAEEPKVSERFLMVDNSMQGIEFEKLPAGDYLILIHDASERPAVFNYSEVADFSGELYKDGAMITPTVYPQCQIIFSETPADQVYFLPCTPAEPEETEPEVTEPEVTEPEVIEPEVTEPEVTEPEVIEPEVTEAEVTEPEVTESEVIEPEVTETEVTEPEVTEPEVTEPEGTDSNALGTTVDSTSETAAPDDGGCQSAVIGASVVWLLAAAAVCMKKKIL